MMLTNTQVKNAKPEARAVKLFDGGGLYLLIAPSGGKLWRLKYRFDGKEKSLSLGRYPEIPLAEARKRREAARELLAHGKDPSEERKAKKAERAARLENNFEAVAREWFEKNAPNWAPTHADKIIKRLENDVFPWLGKRPVADITAPELLKVLRRIEERGAVDTAHRAHQNCGQVMRYAVATGRAVRDPSGDLRGSLPAPKHKHFAALTEPLHVAGLLRAMDAFQGSFTVQCALRLAPLVFVRPGELRKARWADINLDKAEWRYVVSKTKMDHLVPLSTQAVAILRDLRAKTGHREHVFPGRNPRKPMSDMAVNAALRRLGYDTRTEITAHGFRAMARTILHQELNFAPELIEHQLAHRVPDSLGAAYNRTKFIEQRRAMMQSWSDYLEKLKLGAQVFGIREQRAA